MKKAATYIRLSKRDRSLSKEELETSIVNAQNEAREYCKRNDIELVKIYVEKYITGDDPNRPVLQEVIDDAKKGEFHILIVRSLSRLTREGSEKQEDYIILFGYYGVEVVSLTEDTKNELNRLIYGFVHRIPIILARIGTKQMRTGKVAIGKAYIKAPFGYKNVKSPGTYWKINEKAEIVKKVFKMALDEEGKSKIIRKLGITYKLYNKIINNKNYVGVKFSDGKYKSIISHTSYIKNSSKEVVDTKKVEYFGTHEPLISAWNWIKLHPEDRNNELVKALL